MSLVCDADVYNGLTEGGGELCHVCDSAPAAPRLSDLAVNLGDPICEGCFADAFGEECPGCGKQWGGAAGEERLPASFGHPELGGTRLGALCRACLRLPLVTRVDLAEAFEAFREAFLDGVPEAEAWLEDVITGWDGDESGS